MTDYTTTSKPGVVIGPIAWEKLFSREASYGKDQRSSQKTKQVHWRIQMAMCVQISREKTVVGCIYTRTAKLGDDQKFETPSEPLHSSHSGTGPTCQKRALVPEVSHRQSMAALYLDWRFARLPRHFFLYGGIVGIGTEAEMMGDDYEEGEWFLWATGRMMTVPRPSCQYVFVRFEIVVIRRWLNGIT